MEMRNNYSRFGIGVILMGVLGIFSLFDFTINYTMFNFIEIPIPGSPYYLMLRIWPFIYMGCTIGIALVSTFLIFTLPRNSEVPIYNVFKTIIASGNIVLVFTLLYYAFLGRMVENSMGIHQEFMVRMWYFLLLGVSTIVYLIGWIFFLIGCKKEGRNSKVLGSVMTIQVGTIFGFLTAGFFFIMWFLILKTTYENYLPFAIMLYIFSYGNSILSIIGYFSLGIIFPRHSIHKAKAEPTLDKEPIPPEISTEAEYQKPKGHICPNCGSKLPLNEKYCTFCGSSVK
jgi:hypothetical protein